MKMKSKYIVNAVLLTFVFGSLAYALLKNSRNDTSASDSPSPLGLSVPIVEGVEPDWAVYFFYNDVYCETCERLEGYALEAVRTYFEDELDSGEITWRSIDMTTEENEHYAIDFDLYSKSVVLVELDKNEVVRWKNLQDIWDLVDDKPSYTDYVHDSFKEFMDESQ